jgi:hypothetical protein
VWMSVKGDKLVHEFCDIVVKLDHYGCDIVVKPVVLLYL